MEPVSESDPIQFGPYFSMPPTPRAGRKGGDLQYRIELPDDKEPRHEIEGSYVPVRGWVWHPRGVERIEARTSKGRVEAQARFMRPDVVDALAGHPTGLHSGFYIEIDRKLWDDRPEMWAQDGDGKWHCFTVLHDVELKDEIFNEAQRRLLEVLVCPTCHESIARAQAECNGCGREVQWLGETPSFLGDQASPLSGGEPVSRHAALDNVATDYFDLSSGGLFLDAGAGWPPFSRPNIIQLEIERFPSTNVVGDGAELPFRDGTFDGIISHAVMEHVKDPFGYARELIRVLKPGARFICHSAFLQPVHAYPDHYFNTTLEGLKLLFKGARIVEAGVAPFQMPWLTVEWILRSYCAGFTDEEQRERFKNMRIGDLLGDMEEDRPMEQFQALTEHTTLELAAGVYVLGER